MLVSRSEKKEFWECLVRSEKRRLRRGEESRVSVFQGREMK